jgi:hypothetical protein
MQKLFGRSVRIDLHGRQTIQRCLTAFVDHFIRKPVNADRFGHDKPSDAARPGDEPWADHASDAMAENVHVSGEYARAFARVISAESITSQSGTVS